MAQAHTPQSPSLIKQFSNFTRTGAGLEKTLRLVQSLAQTVVATSIDNATITRWSITKSQLALTRRYFRFFNFIDCFLNVYNILGGSGSGDSVLTLLELGKWSCLGLYIVLEDLTILHAMNVWTVPWNKPVLIEAYKLWFYAISFSIIGAIWSLLFSTTTTSGKVKNSKPNQSKKSKGSSKNEKSSPEVKPVSSTAPLMRRIVADGCDLLIPGTFLGWIHVSDVVVGATMVVSTLVSSRDIWAKAQKQ